MAYVKPYIDAAGLHISTYADTRDNLISTMKAIYGDDIYLDTDSQDYQMISAIADKHADLQMLGALLYNNRGPGAATGGGLDGVVKANGIRRKRAGHSLAVLTLQGTAGTIIYNGKAADKAGNLWAISGVVTIPASGEIDAGAMCEKEGRIYADAETITRIMTPTQGWISVTNKAKAITGQETETDAELRARQAISVARPSRTVLLGTIGGIAELPDVTRYKVYENYTNIPDSHGIPGHSICAVVEGGENYSIAEEIYYRKTPGCGTYGDIQVAVTEEMEQNPMECPPMRFFRPRYIDVYVTVKVTPKAGFVNQTQAQIIENVTAYLNSLEIGSDLVLSALYSPILSATKDITNPSFSVSALLIGKSQDNMAPADIPILFNEVTRGIATHVTVEVS